MSTSPRSTSQSQHRDSLRRAIWHFSSVLYRRLAGRTARIAAGIQRHRDGLRVPRFDILFTSVTSGSRSALSGLRRHQLLAVEGN